MRFFFSLSIAKTHYACTHPEGLFSAPLLAVSLVIARLVPLYIHFLSNVLICCHDKEVLLSVPQTNGATVGPLVAYLEAPKPK